jgi:peptide deformylase
MILPIVNYGHPVLRQKGARVEAVTDELRQLVADMLQTMRAAHGVGLAAQQVARALQLTVLDVRGVEDRPSTLEIDGEAVNPERHMPLVLINPEIAPYGESVAGGEGCLSFPEICGEIVRPEGVAVRALDEAGQPFEFKCGGLLARAVLHEYDHLQGILFIDRMSHETKESLREELEALRAATQAQLKRSELAAQAVPSRARAGAQ